MLDSHFDVLLADNWLAQSMHYRLRYQVYCLETGFEDADRFPDGEEKDEFDAYSTHFLVRAKSSGEWVAAIRLVEPMEDRFPMESICHIDPLVKRDLMQQPVIEVSRLSIVENFRRRRHDQNFLYGNRSSPFLEEVYFGARERRRQPEVLLTIIWAAVNYCREHAVRYGFFLITPALAKLLTRFNIHLKAIGLSCRHRGLRCPYALNVEETYLGLTTCSKEITKLFEPIAYRPFSECVSSMAYLGFEAGEEPLKKTAAR
jgi:N-acyl amino acid synthase of PEP-CTERM/exosortase system